MVECIGLEKRYTTPSTATGPSPPGAVYCGTKSAFRAISKGLRQEVKDHDICLTVISLGVVNTELTQHISDPELGDQVRGFVKDIAVPSSTVADMVSFAISQPT